MILYLCQEENPLAIWPLICCDITPDPLLLQPFQSVHVNLMVGVSHVSHNTALLHLVKVLPSHNMLCT